MFLTDIDNNITLLQEGIDFSGHFRFITGMTIDVEPRLFHEIKSRRKTDTEHVGLTTLDI